MRTRLLTLLALTAIVLAVAGIVILGPPLQTSGYPLYVKVTVTFTDGTPVEGATVYFSGSAGTMTSTTNEQGEAMGTIYSKILLDGTMVTGGVRVVYEPTGYDKEVSVMGEVGSLVTVSFTDVEKPPSVQYKLTVYVVDQEGNPLSATVEVYRDSTLVASAEAPDGQAVFTLEQGTYVVKATHDGTSVSQTVELTSSKAVTLTIDVSQPTQTGTLIVEVVDQCGNKLEGAVVEITGVGSFTADEEGKCHCDVPIGQPITITASITIKNETYTATMSITPTESPETVQITITRRFYWKFVIQYTNGTSPTGTLTLEGPETLTVPVKNGLAEAMLLDGTYTVTLTASPEQTLGSITVKNDCPDGWLFLIDPQTGETTSEGVQTTMTPQPKPTLPKIWQWILLAAAVAIVTVAIIIKLRLIKIG